MNTKLLAVIGVMIFCISGLAVMPSEDSDAANYGTAFFCDDLHFSTHMIQGTNASGGNSSSWYVATNTTTYFYFLAPDVSNPQVSRSDWFNDNFSYNVSSGPGTSFVKNGITFYSLQVTITTFSNVSHDKWINITTGNGQYTAQLNFSIDSSSNIVKITFNANGGSSDISKASRLKNSTLGQIPTPTRADYNFLGWFDAQNGGTQYTSSSTVSSTMTLWAHWEAPPQTTYTVSISMYYSSSGTISVTDGVNTSSTFITVSPGSTVTFSCSPASGHVFQRWDYSTMGTNYVKYTTSFSLVVNGDVTAVCRCPSDTIDFRFQSNNGSYGSVSQLSAHALSGAQVYTVGNNLTFINQNGVTTTVVPTPTPDSEPYSYSFVGWADSNGVQITSTPRSYSTNMTFTANFIRITEDYLVTFVADPGYGSFQPVNYLQVPYGSMIYVNGAIVTINNVDITAVANASDSIYFYSFDEWDVENGDVVTGNMTITASFSRTSLGNMVHWSNNMVNGSVSLLFDWTSEENEIHNMSMEFYSGTVNADYTTTWTNTNWQLNISLSYPNTAFSFDLQNNGVSVLTDTVTNGKWPIYELTIDADEGKVWMTPVQSFQSFVDYTLLESQKVLLFDFSSSIKKVAIQQIDHEDTGTGNHVRFSVTNTSVFLNTYGVVMNNPSINVYNYFPQYDKVRVNFYAFAIYGTSMTVNGITYALDGANVTVEYADAPNGSKVLPSVVPGATVKYKTMPLSNISITWDGSHCFLTFESERFTIDLGTYLEGNELVSFSGLWYFTAIIYEPTTTHGKELGAWKNMPDLDKNQMLIVFLGVLTVVGCLLYVKIGGGALDVLIIALAGITAFILLG